MTSWEAIEAVFIIVNNARSDDMYRGQSEGLQTIRQLLARRTNSAVRTNVFSVLLLNINKITEIKFKEYVRTFKVGSGFSWNNNCISLGIMKCSNVTLLISIKSKLVCDLLLLTVARQSAFSSLSHVSTVK